jgi:hypothetical protein
MESDKSMLTTTDHSTIREWVRKFSGLPVQFKNDEDTTGKIILAITFDETRDDNQYRFIAWDEWFNVFEDQKLAFRYHKDQPAYKLIAREDPTDVHLQAPGEANRDKHINFVELEEEGDKPVFPQQTTPRK